MTNRLEGLGQARWRDKRNVVVVKRKFVLLFKHRAALEQCVENNLKRND